MHFNFDESGVYKFCIILCKLWLKYMGEQMVWLAVSQLYSRLSLVFTATQKFTSGPMIPVRQ